MKRLFSNRKNILIIVGIIVLLSFSILGAYAILGDSLPFISGFQSGKYEMTSIDTFESPKDWTPGTTTSKSVVAKNTGDVCQNVRISYDEEWRDSSGEWLPLKINNVKATIINLDHEEDWTRRGNYYYYNKELQSGEETTSFIKSVTFNKDIAGSYICQKKNNIENCSTNAYYSGAKYYLRVKIDTKECEKDDENWLSGNANESIEINKEELLIEPEESKWLVVKVKPNNDSAKEIIWTSSNENVATVNSDGLITGIEEGNATIKAKYKDLEVTCNVTVKQQKVTNVLLNETNVSMIVGDSKTIFATLLPNDAKNQNVRWDVSPSGIVALSVDEDDITGHTVELTGVQVGSAIVTVTTEDGEKTNECNITVEPRIIPVDSISFDQTSLNMTVDGTYQLKTIFSPIDATNTNIKTWASSNTSVASVDSNGKVTAKSVGTATISAVSEDGDKEAECEVTVVAKVVPLTSISISPTTLSMTIGDKNTLKPNFEPTDATNTEVTWTSSNTSVAAVSSSGIVTANSEGTATITASNGDIKGTCIVTVSKPVVSVKSVTLNQTSHDLYVGDTVTLKATVNPTDATDKTVTWKSSNTKVATVSNGKVTAVAGGTATITVTTKNGSKTATCKINVITLSLDKTGSQYIKADNGTITIKATTTGTSTKPTWTITQNSTNSLTGPYGKVTTSTSTTGGTAKVTGLSAGIVTVKVTLGSLSASCKVYVVSITPKMITVKNDVATKDVSMSISPSITPGTNDITWTIQKSSEEANPYVSKVSNITNTSGKSSAMLTLKKVAGAATITVTHKPSGASATLRVVVTNNLKASYSSNTLKYYIDQTDKYVGITHIWVENAYEQMRTAIPQACRDIAPQTSTPCDSKKNYYGLQLHDKILNDEITFRGYKNKGLVGVNASAMIGIANSTYSFYKDIMANWGGTPGIPIVYNTDKNGNRIVIRNGYSDSNWAKIISSGEYKGVHYARRVHKLAYGMTSSNVLKYYNFTGADTQQKGKDIITKMSNDGVKYTFGFQSPFVTNYVPMKKKLEKEEEKHIRNNVCQIDENNFILITSINIPSKAYRGNGLAKFEVAQMMADFGCKIGVPLDGSDSVALWYKKSGSTTVTAIRKSDRRTGDVLYFVEQ